MFTSQSAERRTRQRKGPVRPGLSARRFSPRIEGLESRELLAVTINMFPLPLGTVDNATGIAAGPDDALWFGEDSFQGLPPPQVGRIGATTHAITTFLTSPGNGGETEGITKGPDGALWFSELLVDDNGSFLPGGIGRIDPKTHAVAAFNAPTGSDPGAITSGPDGAVWFTDPNQNRVGRIDVQSHVVTTFPVPTAGSRPAAITDGPDGALWFTEPFTDRIGRIDPKTHVITEFRLPSAGAGPNGITTGPDGAIWFTEATGNRIGRIDPKTHAITEYPLPSGAEFPTEIAAGSDGALWFTQPSFGIGRIDAKTHAITENRIPTFGSFPRMIAAGPDGNIWFTSAVGIGQVVIPPPVITPPTVVSLKRYGIHRQPTTLVLAFNEQLDPARAEDAANYRLIAPNGRTITVDSASYDPGTLTVSLRPHQALNVHLHYRLIVTGTGPGGVANGDGVLLDGAGNGRAGSDYVATVDRSTLVIPKPAGSSRTSRA